MYDLAWESLSVQVKKLLKFYSNAGPEVKSSRGCAGFCQLDPTSCDIFVYETINQICYLGKIEGSYSFLGKQPDAAGFLEVGTKILGVTWFMISYFLYDQAMCFGAATSYSCKLSIPGGSNLAVLL